MSLSITFTRTAVAASQAHAPQATTTCSEIFFCYFNNVFSKTIIFQERFSLARPTLIDHRKWSIDSSVSQSVGKESEDLCLYEIVSFYVKYRLY